MDPRASNFCPSATMAVVASTGQMRIERFITADEAEDEDDKVGRHTDVKAPEQAEEARLFFGDDSIDALDDPVVRFRSEAYTAFELTIHGVLLITR